MKYAFFAVALIAACLGVGWLSYRIRFRGLLKNLEKHLSDERHSTHEGASMSREAFDTAMAALPPEQRYGLGAQLAWPIWQAARDAALEEAAEVCEARKIITPEWQLDQHYNQAATHCAQAIRALKEKE